MSQRQSGPRRMVIMGCDGLAASIAISLTELGHTIHIIDTRAEAFDRLPAGSIEDGHIVPIIGNGSLQQDLQRASVQEADVFMALSSVDTENALAAQMAKHIYQIPTVICRIDDPARQAMYNEIGLVAISATNLVTKMVLEAVGA